MFIFKKKKKFFKGKNRKNKKFKKIYTSKKKIQNGNLARASYSGISTASQILDNSHKRKMQQELLEHEERMQRERLTHAWWRDLNDRIERM